MEERGITLVACSRESASLRIEIVQLDPSFPIPRQAKHGDAGYDLISTVSATIPPAGGRVTLPTGIAIAIPEGFAGFVLPRSGLAARHGITCVNAPGLIDSGFRDEISVILANTDQVREYAVQRGDRIAQLVIQRVESVEWVEVPALPESDRGTGGFGSTGR